MDTPRGSRSPPGVMEGPLAHPVGITSLQWLWWWHLAAQALLRPNASLASRCDRLLPWKTRTCVSLVYLEYFIIVVTTIHVETSARNLAPFWAYILGALGLFIYQSLDAIDGKQARRTNSSSPLGELFDHGCDSISTVFVVLGSCIAIRLGTNPDWLFFCCFVGLFMFYSAHWQTYVSGILRFGKVDVTEVQIAITMLLLISAYGGTAIWEYKVPLVGLELKFFAVFGILCGTALSFFNYFRVIFGGGVGKNGSTIAVAHMTKSEICLQDTAFIGPGLLFLDQYFNSFVDEYIVLWIALFISLFDMLRYATGVCLQIAAHLHIHVFRISSHQAPEQVQNHND
ncbi:PREDICTED: cholinephosphotransferase 1 [Charadrius vociferus]|uniref:cholinephosphotransferase 1 n=1 Tax=Charadrius vociferus TaxID=50402 RepID=UPI000521A597|nr:PREDICTED: cholinephosphotransferase 1 [Charadrius vociferus]